MTSAVQADEILSRIIIPLHKNTSCGYRKFRHPASGYAVAAAAVVLRFENDGCAGGRIGVTGVSDTPFNARAAEALLERGFDGTPAQIDEVASVAVAGVQALEDGFADAAYRLQLASVMVKRALTDAIDSKADSQ
jgi:carbon-monoxide dehydrogenase medium subunit